MTDEESEGPVDGRTLRSRRTRRGIVDATIALVERGDLRPTAPRVAEEAGVSVRSVFQHFDDLESLFSAVAQRIIARVAVLIEPVDPTMAFAERLARFLAQRSATLEALTPIRRAAAIHAPFSAEITARLQAGYEFLRSEVRAAFDEELGGVPPDQLEAVCDQLEVAVSWPTWETLRTQHGRSLDEATAVVGRMIRSALTPVD